MQQIAEWLEKLGMSEYAQRFAESDIDIAVLRDLTDQDLIDLVCRLGIAGECCAQSESLALRPTCLAQTQALRSEEPPRTAPSAAKSL